MKAYVRNTLSLLLAALLLFQCAPDEDLQKELSEAKAVLAKLEAEIKALKSAHKGQLIHVVYFKLKPDIGTADKEKLITEIERLKEVPTVKTLIYGDFLDVGDPRAMSDYGIVMQLHFADKVGLEAYQTHPTHLDVRKNAGPFLGGPPVTYDFFVK